MAAAASSSLDHVRRRPSRRVRAGRAARRVLLALVVTCLVGGGTAGAASESTSAAGRVPVHLHSTWLEATAQSELDLSLAGRRGGPAPGGDALSGRTETVAEGMSRSDWRDQTLQHAALQVEVQQQAVAAAAAEAAAAAAAAQAAAQAQAAAAAQAAYDASVEAAVANPRALAAAQVAARGWGGGEFGCLDSLWTRESNWNYQARNRSSGAYGIPQSLPATKMATAGSDWLTNPVTQITWGLDYITRSYGSPCGAWAHSRAYGWY